MFEEIQLRPAEKSDLLQLSRLVNSAYRGDVSRQGWTTEADLLDGQRTDAESLSEMLGDQQFILLAESRSKDLLGCVFLKNKSQDLAYLGMLTVKPDQQANGLGKKILAAGENFAREQWRSKKMEMTVISIRQELIEWYERRGYKNTWRSEDFPYGNIRFGQPKRDDLKFVILEKNL